MLKKQVQVSMALILILSLLVVSLPSVAAQETIPVQVNGLLVFAEPNASSTLIAVMSLGSSLTVFPNDVQNGFTRVTIPTGASGWAQLDTAGVPGGGTNTLLSGGSGGGISPTGVIVVSRGNVRMRDVPSINGIRIGFIPWGETADLLARDSTGDWYQINYLGTVGWVSAAWFRIVSGSSNAIGITAELSPQQQTINPDFSQANVEVANAFGAGSLVQALGNMRLRDEPGEFGARIGLVPWGGVATLLGYDTTGEWIKVDYQGLIGWTAAAWWTAGANTPQAAAAQTTNSATGAVSTTAQVDLGNENVANVVVVSSPTGVVVQSLGNLRLRDQPSEFGARIAGIAWGDQAAALGVSADGLWFYLDYAGLQGWSSAVWFKPVSGDIKSLPVR